MRFGSLIVVLEKSFRDEKRLNLCAFSVEATGAVSGCSNLNKE
jgi:hypothetical protein